MTKPNPQVVIKKSHRCGKSNLRDWDGSFKLYARCFRNDGFLKN